MQEENARTFMMLVAHIDSQLKSCRGRLEFRFRNDAKFERLCDETLRLYEDLGEDAQGKIAAGTGMGLLQAIDRFEERYLRRINLARARRAEQFWQEIEAMIEATKIAGIEMAGNDDDDDYLDDEKEETYFRRFDEHHHRPVLVLNELIDLCWDLASFDEDEFPHAHQKLVLAEGAMRYIEKRLGLDIDSAADRFRRLETFHIPPRLLAADDTDWRRVDRYLQQAITAYSLGLDLCAIALARPLAAQIIRTVYAPALRPDIDLTRINSETELLRKVQETKEGSWIKGENGERLIDHASKVLHFRHFDDLKTENSTAVLARELLLFVRYLLHRAPA